MPRPRATHPKARVHVTLPEDLYGQIVLLIADPTAERGFTQGAMSAFFEAAARDRLRLLADARTHARRLLEPSEA